MRRLTTICLVACMSLAAMAQQATPLIGTWSGKLKVGAMSLTLVLHFEQEGADLKCTLDSPDQGAKGISVHKEFVSADSVSLSVPAIGAGYRARLADGKLTGTFSQMGIGFPLVMEKKEYKVLRPQTPRQPFPYETEEVTFANNTDNATLAGTLTYPVGYDKMRDVPVVIMVTGSGLQNRDEEIFSHKPFLVIADYLARHGIATLRYDDRSHGASTGGDRIKDKATTLDYKRDAQAGIDYLRGMRKFGMVGVLGHSEGGSIAFMLGGEKCVDFVISLAGLGVKADTALTAQYNRILELQGQKIQISTSQYRQIAHLARSEWMNWFVDYNPAPDIASTTCPVFAVNGGKDCQVISSLNLPAIEKTLPYNRETIIKEYPSLNHLLQNCDTGLPAEYNNIEETISAEVLTDMAEWINKLGNP